MSNKMCKKYKELIMENMDNEISTNDKIQLDIHIKSCENCRIYLKKMEKIKKVTNSLIYDIPPFMEEKIMSKINEREFKQPVFVFNFRKTFAYAVSFVFILFISIFLIYNKFDNKIVQLADTSTDLKIKIQKQVNNIQTKQNNDAVSDIKTDVIKQELKEQPNILKEDEVKQENNNTIVLKQNNVIDEKSQVKPVQDYNIKKIDTIQPGLSAAKVTPIPPLPYNPLLEQDKAIVANNLINPLQGDKAIIRFIVDDTSFVKIVIYDKNIRPVSVILNEEKSRGTYEATWAGKSDNNEIVSEGVYFVYIQIGTRVIKKSIIVNK